MMRDIFDDYIEDKIRFGEICAAVVVTGVVTKLIDVAGLADQVTSAFDWFAIVTAVLLLSYFTAGSIHDAYDKHRESKYTTVYRKHQENAA
jgi:putative copper export protein